MTPARRSSARPRSWRRKLPLPSHPFLFHGAWSARRATPLLFSGIDCAVRGYRFRRLLYFFGPLFKMALLVPGAERERALRLVEDTPFRIA